MQCRTCGYALLNLSEPRCPECGSGFDIRSYRFVPDTVAFACPYCDHLHGGSGESYLPATTEQATCLGCGQAMTVSAMRVVPLANDVKAYSTDRVPWEDHQQLGRWRAFWRTWGLAMVMPHKLGPMVGGPGGSFVAALGFAMIVNGVAFAIFSLSWIVLFAVFFVLFDSMGTGSGLGMSEILFASGCCGGVTLFGLLLPLLITAIHGGGAHLLLAITGRHDGDFNTTARSLLYAQSPALIVAMPFCGVPYGWAAAYLWTCISAVFVLMAAHRIGPWRAIIASFWVPTTVFVVVVGFYTTAVVWQMQSVSQMPHPVPMPPPVNVPSQPAPPVIP